ncbi:hypothetical protein B0T16DRAFT_398130 [Cercophora newfieldiana]|uniref:DUF7704 domain-containing protein n=1 Tax=Cercophora newfieldiana TaxID=92897 RepID=A0AA39YNR8_9PEZI|nr:hypothetical protein B0T16DRAFT_398130 [Cercophora newfieldiana]
MASQLPAFPRFVFTILEPISLLAGAVPAIFDTQWFISEQIASPAAVTSSPQAVLATQQLGNCYFLAFLLAIAVLYSTSEIKVVRNYLIALWIADITHIAITMFGLGYNMTMAPGTWNAVTWGNIGATGFLFLTRNAYFLGVFGADGQLSKGKKGQ